VSSVDELPIGTVTFLFTDIEGSTQLLKRLRDRYGEALEDHQRILREAFAEHGGHEIDTQGDSFFVAFRRAKDAVSAAITCQRRLAEHVWPDDTELRVRMGIHTGEPAMGGERYVGLGVHRAARICAAGSRLALLPAGSPAVRTRSGFRTRAEHGLSRRSSDERPAADGPGRRRACGRGSHPERRLGRQRA
jgi:class 3 adenylate cyclase